ncbi:uncharacterized protein LOC128883254 [Hylaeus volcanicus]|uniref:uncharacterized protein LOC128883254 n=1 Tax=Hylaeus volcanicus TaxID=313075 RepID=UPI0023B843B9|nr:uncharacterized protein LOC128883254 [Hylaeus volcanicus]
MKFFIFGITFYFRLCFCQITHFNKTFFLNNHTNNEQSILHKSNPNKKHDGFLFQLTKEYEPYDLEKIIIVYQYGECSQIKNDGLKKVEHEDSVTSNKKILFWNQRSRDEAFRQFEWSIRKLYKEYVSTMNVIKNIRSFNINSVTNFRSLIDKKSEQIPFPPLQSKYYKTINMEVVKVPSFMTAKEMINLTNTIPCVFNAVKDYEKKMFHNTDINETFETLNESMFITLLEPTFVKKSKEEINKKTTTTTTHTNTTKQVNHNITKTNKNVNTMEANGYRNLSILRNSFSGNFFNFLKPKESVLIPNDPLFSNQWYLLSNNKFGIDAQRGWSMLHPSKSYPVIAVVDDGCDLFHPDIASKLWKNPNEICDDGIDNDQNGYIDDCYGWDWTENDNDMFSSDSNHGTAVAGVVAASTNNRKGIAAVCWECKIMCLRFIKEEKGIISHEVAALDYAVTMGAKISINSYGGYGWSALEHEIIRRLDNLGHLMICSAGNDNLKINMLVNQFHTPSSYQLSNIVSVSSSLRSGAKHPSGNYGNNYVDMFAPGASILSVYKKNQYRSYHGTSFSAPLVAGIAALVWAQNPSLSHRDVRQVLLKSCRPSKELTGLCKCNGVISLSRALENVATFKTQTMTYNGRKSLRSLRFNPFQQATPVTNFLQPFSTQTNKTNEKTMFQPNLTEAHATLKRLEEDASYHLTHGIHKFVKSLVRWVPITPLTAFLLVN